MIELFDAAGRFFDAFPAWVNAGLSVVAAASAVTALTPGTDDDRVAGRARRILEWLALNVGHATPKR